jgi:hypothetical protein
MLSLRRSYVDDEFYFIIGGYYYNSLNSDFKIYTEVGTIQIPEGLVKNILVIETLDKSKLNGKPVVKRNENNTWEIDLKYYEQDYKL